MRKNGKKLWALLLAAALTTASMAGCGQEEKAPADETGGNTTEDTNKDSNEETGGEAETSGGEAEADPFGKYEEEITLRAAWVDSGKTVFIPGEPDYDSIEKNLWMEAYKEELGINIVYDWTSADMDAYNTKWNMAMAQQNLPDFGMVTSEQYKMLLDAGLVMDMTDIFEAYASDKYKEYLEADGGATLSYSLQDGRMMGLPLTGAQPDEVSLFTIRKDWLDKVNMEVPTTIDELAAAAEAFTENKLGGDDTYGLVSCKSAFDMDNGLGGFLNGYGAYPKAWIKDDSGKLIYGATSDKVKEPLLKLQEMYQKGLINQDFSVTDRSMTREDVAAGKVGIVYGTYYLATGVEDNIKKDPEANWVVAEIPTSDGSKPIVQGSVKRNMFIFVNKDCEHPEAVVKLMNLQTEKIYNDDPEVVTRYTTHIAPDGETSVQTTKYLATVFYAGMPWQNMVRYREATKALETGEEDFSLVLSQTTLGELKQYQSGDINKVAAWYIFGPEGTFSVISKMLDEDRIILDEYQALPTETMTAKSSILNEALEAAMVKVIMGEDISTYEKAVEEWYQNGGQIMTDEANAWYENSGTK